ncbi:MAG: class I SAM-dependent methyltransferase [Candidatus Sungbacteria bacterium]|uniref:Class I SAM-dependent methyltransferase n=1 Tax=Candidatus Sungiibacteriota bacterium TaxID=2750080 RepID=A0A9D6LT49_9BACT|nr:class I SAM-dependent methyltransferase [Candidatus Sungbacteria bacterium]
MHNVQVEREHYFNWRYIKAERWMSYWHQLENVVSTKPQSVLEIGVGNSIVRETLKKLNIQVTTVDIDASLNPDLVASVVKLPLADNSFDTVLAAEILEHIPFGELENALGELHRVSQEYVVISLPHVGSQFMLSFKIPLLKKVTVFFKVPHFWKTKTSTPEHHWEIGMSGFSLARIRHQFKEARFRVLKARGYADDPAHIHFILEKHD